MRSEFPSRSDRIEDKLHLISELCKSCLSLSTVYRNQSCCKYINIVASFSTYFAAIMHFSSRALLSRRICSRARVSLPESRFVVFSNLFGPYSCGSRGFARDLSREISPPASEPARRSIIPPWNIACMRDSCDPAMQSACRVSTPIYNSSRTQTEVAPDRFRVFAVLTSA